MSTPLAPVKLASGGFRWLSVLLFALALAAVGGLALSDLGHHLAPNAQHTQCGSAALILIGLSYICLQLSLRRGLEEMLQGLLLGTAFVLWGGEQLLPPSRFVTLMDNLVVTIFVIDLSVIIWEHLQRQDYEVP